MIKLFGASTLAAFHLLCSIASTDNAIICGLAIGGTLLPFLWGELQLDPVADESFRV